MPATWTKLIHSPKQQWWFNPLLIFVTWRLLVEIIGRLALHYLTPALNPWPLDPQPPLWARWDSGWYSAIVAAGYSLKNYAMSNVTFFPLYPLLWKLVWWLSPWSRFASGVLTANLAALSFSLIFFHWVQNRYHTAQAQKALIILLAFPTSFFLISAYSESLFMLLVVIVFLLADKKQWAEAALVAGLASAARPVGLSLWPTLIYLYYTTQSSQTNQLVNLKNQLAVWLLPPIGLAAFSGYLWWQLNEPWAWAVNQQLAGRIFTWPWHTLTAYFFNIVNRGDLWLTHLSEAAALLFVSLLLPAVWRLNKGYLIFIVTSLLPALFSGTLGSLPRFVLALPPLFVIMAQVTKPWRWLYLSLSLPLLALAIIRFVTWRWVS